MAEERPLYLVLNRELPPQAIWEISCLNHVYFTAHAGEERHVLMMDAVKYPIDDLDIADGNELWTGDPNNGDFEILDKVIEAPCMCYLIHKNVPSEKVELLGNTFEIVEVNYEKETRFGIVSGYYQAPTGDVPFRVTTQWRS